MPNHDASALKVNKLKFPSPTEVNAKLPGTLSNKICIAAYEG